MTFSNHALVIDDHPLVARGIAAFLHSHCGFEDVLSVANSEEAWLHIDLAAPPALIVLDFWLANGESIKLLSELKIRCSVIPILVMSADDDTAVQNKVKMAGGDGFINKQEAPDIFAQAVANLLNGKTWFVHTNPQRLSISQPKELAITASELGLTARQGEILAMIIQGLPNKRIAKALSLSEQTVKEHVTGILSRLGVVNRIEAITKLRGKRLV